MRQINDSKSRTILSIIFAFLVFISITGLIFCSVVSLTVFNEGYLNRCLDKSRYIDKTYQDLVSVLEEEAAAHDLDQDFFKEVLDEDQFKDELKANIDKSFQSKSTGSNSGAVDSWEDAVRNEIVDYLTGNDIGENRWIDSAVDEIVDISVNYYINYSAFPFGSFFYEYKTDYSKPIMIMIPVFLIIAVILSILLFRMQSDLYRGWHYFISSVLASAFVSIIGGAVFHFTVSFTFKGSLVGYESFINRFFDDVSAILIMSGIVIIILAIIGSLLLRRRAVEKVNDEYQ